MVPDPLERQRTCASASVPLVANSAAILMPLHRELLPNQWLIIGARCSVVYVLTETPELVANVCIDDI